MLCYAMKAKMMTCGLTAAAAFYASAACAADACIELIRHAVYDQVAGSSETSSYREASEKFCKSIKRSKSDSEEVETGGSYAKVYEGIGNVRATQSRAFAEAMCDDTYSLDKFHSNRQLFTSILNPTALHVVDNCIRNANEGVLFAVDYPDEDTLVASVSFRPQTGDPSTYRQINSRPYIPQGLSCKGALAEAKKGTHITIKSMDMTCIRIAPFSVFRLGDRQFIHNGGAVVVSASTRPLIALMPKKPDPNYVHPVAPQPIDIAGQWMFRGAPTPKYAQVAIVTGTNKLTFTNERGAVSQGYRMNDLTAEAFDWNHITAEIRDRGQILIWSNGSWWSRAAFDHIDSRKSDRPLVDTSWRYIGRPCSITGSDQNLTFINENGGASAGKLLDPTTVQATGWGIKGKLIGDRSAILWSNGTVWVR